MKKYTSLSVLLLAGVIITGCSSVNHIGKIGDADIYRVTTRGFFSPSSTTVITTPGADLEVLSAAHGPGVLPAIATAGGIAGAAALLRPARTQVSNSSATDIDNGVSSGNVNVITPAPRTPPGLVDNPGHSK